MSKKKTPEGGFNSGEPDRMPALQNFLEAIRQLADLQEFFVGAPTILLTLDR